MKGPRDRVRRAVISAARELIVNGGYQALTVDALVATSGISKKTIYRWWDNRAEVALDMAEELFGRPTSSSRGSAVDLVADRLVTEAKYLAGPPGDILGGLLADSRSRPALAATVERRYFQPRREELRGLLQKAIEEGDVAPDTDLGLAATVLFAPLLYALLIGFPLLGTQTAKAVAEQLIAGIGVRIDTYRVESNS